MCVYNVRHALCLCANGCYRDYKNAITLKIRYTAIIHTYQMHLLRIALRVAHSGTKHANTQTHNNTQGQEYY